MDNFSNFRKFYELHFLDYFDEELEYCKQKYSDLVMSEEEMRPEAASLARLHCLYEWMRRSSVPPWHA